MLSFKIDCIDTKENFWIHFSSKENAEQWTSLATIQKFPPILHEVDYFIIHILEMISIISDRVSRLFSYMIRNDSFSMINTDK
jgi:hypothetical protein